MRKILSFILTLVACLGLGGLVYNNTVNAATPGFAEETYSHLFTKEHPDWSFVTDETFKEYNGKDGIHVGSGKKEVKSLTITSTNSFTNVTRVAVEARDSGTAATYAKINVSVGTTKLSAEQTLNDSSQKYIFTSPNNEQLTGNIEISVARPQLAKKAIYVKSVDVITEVSAESLVDLTFDHNYEGSKSEIRQIDQNVDVNVNELYTPVREGYVFAGWYYEKECVNQVININTAEARTLYARWEIDIYSHAVVNKDSFKTQTGKPSNSYVDFNGLHQISDVTLESKSVMLNGTNLQIKKNEGFLTNAKPLGKIESVTFKGQSDSDAKILFSQTPIDYKTAVEKGNVVLAGTDTYAAGENDRYFMIVATATFTASDIIINYVPATVKDYFEAAETKSSLKITYALDTKEPTDVDLRFGGMISADAFDSTAEYGVIVVPTTEDLTNVTPEKLAELKTKNMVMTCTPARVDEKGVASETGSYYQFAWVITNMEGHYDYAFNSVMYMVKDGKVYLSQVNKNDSVQTVAKRYVDNSVKLGLTEEQVQVLNKLLPQA